jgi:hypothetical protein
MVAESPDARGLRAYWGFSSELWLCSGLFSGSGFCRQPGFGNDQVGQSEETMELGGVLG